MDGLLMLAAGITLKLATELTSLHSVDPCALRIHQAAASVQLNRPDDGPGAVCVKSCEADLVGAHRESGLLVALAIYNGRSCP